jgi:hypothetical protein
MTIMTMTVMLWNITNKTNKKGVVMLSKKQIEEVANDTTFKNLVSEIHRLNLERDEVTDAIAVMKKYGVIDFIGLKGLSDKFLAEQIEYGETAEKLFGLTWHNHKDAFKAIRLE